MPGGFGSDYASQAELDRRFQELSDRIDQRALANPEATTPTRSGGIPPAPSGITLVSNPAPGTITVKWNAVSISDLRRYEIQVSTSADFTNASTFSSGATTFTYDEGLPLTTYYVRARTINTSNNPSAWSKILNTTTGQAFSADLAIASAANWARTVVTTFDPAKLQNYAPKVLYGDYATTTLITKGGLVLFFATAEMEYDLKQYDTLYVEILMDGVLEQSYAMNNQLSDTTGLQSMGGSGIIAPPSNTAHSFTLRIRLTDNNFTSVTPKKLQIAVVEIGREGLS